MEDKLMAVAHEFTTEILKLEGFKAGARLALSVTVKIVGWKGDGEPKIELAANFRGADDAYVTLHGSSLRKLMNEVYRRLDFEDSDMAEREANNAALKAIADQRLDREAEANTIEDGDLGFER